MQLPRLSPMKIFSLSHLIELAPLLPDPSADTRADSGDAAVIRLPLRDWDAMRDADYAERKFDAYKHACVEVEAIPWKETRGATAPRWVLCGRVAI